MKRIRCVNNKDNLKLAFQEYLQQQPNQKNNAHLVGKKISVTYLLPNHKPILTPFAGAFAGVKTLHGKSLQTFERNFL